MQWVELSAQQRARHRIVVIGAVIVASLAGLLVGWSEAQSKELTPAEVVRAGLEIAGDICIYTNRNIDVQELT